jgi:hypothetical protein
MWKRELREAWLRGLQDGKRAESLQRAPFQEGPLLKAWLAGYRVGCMRAAPYAAVALGPRRDEKPAHGRDNQ